MEKGVSAGKGCLIPPPWRQEACMPPRMYGLPELSQKLSDSFTNRAVGMMLLRARDQRINFLKLSLEEPSLAR